MRTIILLGMSLMLAATAFSPLPAQDEKGTVNAAYANMATAAELLTLGNTWDVTGCCGWIGTWRRRPNTNTFDTKWRHSNGTPVAFIVNLRSWNKRTNEIILHQPDNNGTYRAFLANGGAAIVNGTTSFYPAGATWSAVVDIDQKGQVNYISR